MIHYYRAFLRTFTLADQPGDDDVWRWAAAALRGCRRCRSRGPLLPVLGRSPTVC